MKAVPLSALALALSLLTNNAFAIGGNPPTEYGDKVTLDKPVSVEYAIEHYGQFKNKEILIKGKATKVCQKKGCWMVLKGEENEVRVTFKNYGFFVPQTILDKQVLAQGTLIAQILKISEARHYAEDAGQSAETIQSISQPVREFRFIATAVKEQP